MSFVLHPGQFWLIGVAGWINRSQQEAMEYLRAENRCARTPTNHGQIVRQSRNSPDPKQQSAEFSNSPCLKNRLNKRLIARLCFLTTRGDQIMVGAGANLVPLVARSYFLRSV